MKILAIFAIVAAALSVNAQELPKQSGFEWWKIPDLKGAMLVPEGWHTKQCLNGSAKGYFISKTKITKESPVFETGLTLNVLNKFKTKKGKDPVVWAKLYRDIAAKKGEVLKSWDNDMGPFKSVGFRLRTVDEKGSFIMHHLFVINPKTDTLYFYLFEAPEEKWDDAWKPGEKIMKMLLIDDEV